MNAPDLPSLLTDKQFRPYLDDVRLWHGYVRYLGLPTMIDNPDTPMSALFVTPLLHDQSVTPESDVSAWPKGQSLLSALNANSRLVVLGDPGCGKSTLLNWLAWLLAGGSHEIVVPSLVAALPLPLIARELRLEGVNGFDALVDAFLERPVAAKLRDHRQRVIEQLESGRAAVLLDGLDEVAPKLREPLRDALREGAKRFPAAVFVVTSRMVGYAAMPLELAVTQPDIYAEFPMSRQSERAFYTSTERYQRAAELHDAETTVWRRQYVMPFDDTRIAAFAERWYSLRAIGADPNLNAKKFVAAVFASASIHALARVPQLLTLMALVHRIGAKLPDGRAILYDQISEAYLRSIDSARGLAGASDESNWKEKQRWLSRVAFEMQLLRWKNIGDPANSANSANSANVGRDLLIPREDVQRWISEAMAQSGYPAEDVNVSEYLDWVARRSGLLLPRGEGYFAFVHLSFQEYFAALYLTDHLADADWIMAQSGGAAFLEGDPRVSGLALGEWGRNILWQEVFVFASEMFSSRPRDARRLASWLFGKDFSDSAAAVERLAQLKKSPAADQVPEESRMELLVRLAINPHSGWDADLRLRGRRLAFRYTDIGEDIFHNNIEYVNREMKNVTRRIFSDDTTAALFREWIAAQSPTTLNLQGIGKIAATQLPRLERLGYLSIDEIPDNDINSIAKIYPSLHTLSIRSSSLQNISGIEGLRNLQRLGLLDTLVDDIEPLRGLTALRIIIIRSARLRSIEALSNLVNLEKLDIFCADVNNIEPLRSCTRLETLYAIGMKLSSLAPLDELHDLRAIWVDSGVPMTPALLARQKAGKLKIHQ